MPEEPQSKKQKSKEGYEGCTGKQKQCKAPKTNKRVTGMEKIVEKINVYSLPKRPRKHAIHAIMTTAFPCLENIPKNGFLDKKFADIGD